MSDKKETFRQRAKVGVAGSFNNQLMANNSTLPVVGKGATEMHYTDRSCYEVIEVSKDYKTVKLEELSARHDKSKEGGMGHQNWILEPTGRFIHVYWKYGAWRTKKVEVLYEDAYYEAYEKRKREIGHKEAYAEMIAPLFDGNGNLKFVEGKTKQKTNWDKMKLLFGVKDYHYDWEF